MMSISVFIAMAGILAVGVRADTMCYSCTSQVAGVNLCQNVTNLVPVSCPGPCFSKQIVRNPTITLYQKGCWDDKTVGWPKFNNLIGCTTAQLAEFSTSSSDTLVCTCHKSFCNSSPRLQQSMLLLCSVLITLLYSLMH